MRVLAKPLSPLRCIQLLTQHDDDFLRFARCRTQSAVDANNATFFFRRAIPRSIQSHCGVMHCGLFPK